MRNALISSTATLTNVSCGGTCNNCTPQRAAKTKKAYARKLRLLLCVSYPLTVQIQQHRADRSRKRTLITSYTEISPKVRCFAVCEYWPLEGAVKNKTRRSHNEFAASHKNATHPQPYMSAVTLLLCSVQWETQALTLTFSTKYRIRDSQTPLPWIVCKRQKYSCACGPFSGDAEPCTEEIFRHYRVTPTSDDIGANKYTQKLTICTSKLSYLSTRSTIGPASTQNKSAACDFISPSKVSLNTIFTFKRAGYEFLSKGHLWAAITANISMGNYEQYPWVRSTFLNDFPGKSPNRKRYVQYANYLADRHLLFFVHTKTFKSHKHGDLLTATKSVISFSEDYGFGCNIALHEYCVKCGRHLRTKHRSFREFSPLISSPFSLYSLARIAK